MFMHRRERRQIEATPDFLQARSVSVLLNEVVQVVQDFALSFCKREHSHLRNRAGPAETPVAAVPGRGGETICE